MDIGKYLYTSIINDTLTIINNMERISVIFDLILNRNLNMCERVKDTILYSFVNQSVQIYKVNLMQDMIIIIVVINA